MKENYAYRVEVAASVSLMCSTKTPIEKQSTNCEMKTWARFHLAMKLFDGICHYLTFSRLIYG